ncbi:Defective in cullin neddylation protein [Abortiporus biennis]
MPPKRKHTTEDTVSTPARATRSSTRKQAGTAEGGAADEHANSATAEPPAKRTKKTAAKASKASTPKSKAAKAQAAIDDAGQVSRHKLSDDHDATQSTSTATVTLNGHGPSASSSKSAASVTKKPNKSKKACDFEPYSASSATALFGNYADEDDPNVIGPEGFEKLCNDAEISLEGALPLILAWQLGASEMAKISKEEWEKGTSELRISSVSSLAVALHDLEDLLLLDKPALKPPTTTTSGTKKSTSSSAEPYNRSRYFKYASDKKKSFGELYTFCFMLAKPPQGRNIDMETACAFWSVLVAPRYPLAQELLNFINEKGTYKGVNKDLWSMTLEFCQTISPNLEDYEADGAWPTMLDDFVAWKNNQNPSDSNGSAD